MDRRLLRPRWLVAHLAVLALGALFVALGVWQLGRLDERETENLTAQNRFTAPLKPLDELLAEADGVWDQIEFRRASVTGVYDTSEEILIRSQVHLGTAGFHVVTPLVRENGDTVLVNRGWVPLSAGDRQITEAFPPPGTVTVEGWLQTTQTRPPLGREEPDGDLSILNRIDIQRIQEQTPHPLDPVYLVETREAERTLPATVDPPDFTDQGPHLAYAVQWFGFAAVLFVGYFFLSRRRLATSQEDSGSLARPSTTS